MENKLQVIELNSYQVHVVVSNGTGTFGKTYHPDFWKYNREEILKELNKKVDNIFSDK